jgi:general secretion pathway protein J
LIEILVAIGIFAMVLAAIFSTWTAILRASRVGLEAAAAVQRARMASRTLEECLGSAVAFARTQQAHPEYYSFDPGQEAGSSSLEFTARLAKSFPRSGKFGGLEVRRVTFSVQSAPEGGKELVLRQKPILWDKWDKDEQNFPLVLAKNVREFKLEYWDKKQQDWSSEFNDPGRFSTNLLPVMVKVTLKLGDNAHSTMVREEVTRIVSLPCTTVQPGWQPWNGGAAGPIPNTPGAPGTPGQPGGGTPPINFVQPGPGGVNIKR